MKRSSNEKPSSGDTEEGFTEAENCSSLPECSRGYHPSSNRSHRTTR